MLSPAAAVGAAFALFFREVDGFSIDRHSFRLDAPAFAVLFVAAFGLLVVLWRWTSKAMARRASIDIYDAARRNVWTFAPLLALGLAPLAAAHYIGRDDLRARLQILLFGAVGLVVVLQAVLAARLRAASPKKKDGAIDRFVSWPAGRRVAVLFVASLLLFTAGAALLISQGVSFSGDEPHYLLMTHSLLHDGDLDLANNYAGRDYSAYMPPVPLERHVVPGRRPGSAYSFHSPGTAFLMLPFYAAGSLFGTAGLVFWIRLGMAVFGALFAVQLYLLARSLLEDERRALAVWALAVAATPVFFYSIHVYPEIIAGLLALVVYRWFRAPTGLTRGRIALGGALLAALIWFHALKYIFITAPLLLVGLWALAVRRKERRAESLALFLVPFALLTALYFVFQSSLYGSASLSTVSWKGSLAGGETLSYVKSLLTDIPFRFRWETLAGYFLDQKDGLLFYAPVYAFAFLGFAGMLRRGGRAAGTALEMAFVAAPYILVSAFLTQRTGYAPQARPLVSVIWAFAVGVGWFLADNRNRMFRWLAGVAAAAGVAVTVLLLRNPAALYQETTQGSTERGGALFYVLSNLHHRVTTALPSFIKTAEGRWLPNFVWIAALAVLVVIYLAAARRTGKAWPFAVPVSIGAGAAVLLFVGLVLFPRPVLLDPAGVAYPDGPRLTFFSLSRVARQVEPGRFLLPQDGRSYIFTFRSLGPLSKLRLETGSREGDYGVTVDYFDKTVFRGTIARDLKAVALDAPPAYDWKGSSLYWLTIRVDAAAGTRPETTPCVFAITPGK